MGILDLTYPRMLRMIVKELGNRARLATDESGTPYVALVLHGIEHRVLLNQDKRRKLPSPATYQWGNHKDTFKPIQIYYRRTTQEPPTLLEFVHATNFVEWYDTVTTGSADMARDIREKRRQRP